ncbi:MAG: ABC-2 transporter permease [Clostridiales bacterium]|nr:ABC-2 transporter permease [Clostridiales bacterium]
MGHYQFTRIANRFYSKNKLEFCRWGNCIWYRGNFFGILLPICFKYSYQKAVLYSQVFLFSFAMVFVLLSKSSRISWERIASIYSGWYNVAGIFIGILAFFLSYLVSKAIFEARDF